MANFQTTIATMDSAAGHVDTVNDQIRAELRRLTALVEETAGSWKGEAQGSFAGTMDRWNTSAKNLSEALTSIAENIRANSQAFANTESENRGAFN